MEDIVELIKFVKKEPKTLEEMQEHFGWDNLKRQQMFDVYFKEPEFFKITRKIIERDGKKVRQMAWMISPRGLEYLKNLVPETQKQKGEIYQMNKTIHLRKFLEKNPYDSEAKRRLLEIGSPEDLEWLMNQYPYDPEVKEAIIQKGDAIVLRKFLEKNPYDSEAKRRLLEIGSPEDLEWLMNQYPYDPEVKEAIISYEPNKRSKTNEIQNRPSSKNFDVFICHASEDKELFVEPLARALTGAGIKVWYDDFVLQWGDSLRESIDKGLVNSRYGIVVFSKAFLNKKKKWTKHELDGLFAKEVEGEKVILPIWHNISRDDLLKYSPAFADRLAKPSDSIEDIVNDVKKFLGKE